MITLKSITKTVLLIVCFSIYESTHAQTTQNSDDIIFWTETYRLQFADFKGAPAQQDTAMQKVNAAKLTHKLGSIKESVDVRVDKQNGKTVFIVNGGMKRNESWIKNNGDTITLRHEQGHFDICEIYARMLRRDLLKAKSLAEAREMFEKASNDEASEQDKYDAENTFQTGGITVEWQANISTRLHELDEYDNNMVTLPFNS